jgi:hypothetical protein
MRAPLMSSRPPPAGPCVPRSQQANVGLSELNQASRSLSSADMCPARPSLAQGATVSKDGRRMLQKPIQTKPPHCTYQWYGARKQACGDGGDEAGLAAARIAENSRS